MIRSLAPTKCVRTLEDGPWGREKLAAAILGAKRNKTPPAIRLVDNKVRVIAIVTFRERFSSTLWRVSLLTEEVGKHDDREKKRDKNR